MLRNPTVVHMATQMHRGIPIPALGAEFFIDEHGEEFVRRLDPAIAKDNQDSDPETRAAAMRGGQLNWTSAVIPVRQLTQEMKWGLEQTLKLKLQPEEFLRIRPGAQ